MPENEAVNHKDTDLIWEAKDRLNSHMYFILIFILSVIALTFFPTIGSDGDIMLKVPSTAAGWILYVFTKVASAFINVFIFYCFIQQGRKNVRNNPLYLQAEEILVHLKTKSPNIISPKQWLTRQYTRKGVVLFLSTLLSMFCISNAVLEWSWSSMLSYAVTITIGILFGIIQMHQTEEWWTTKYLEYAINVQNKEEELNERSIEECPGTSPAECQRHSVPEGIGDDSKPEHQGRGDISDICSP